MRWLIALILLASPVQSGTVEQLARAADAAFARMPQVVIVPQIAGNCGATSAVDRRVAYCTSDNRILVAKDIVDQPATLYLLGHAFGHAVQVRHGVADDALQAIRSRPAQEMMLRGLVERQVDCIAGFLLHRSGASGLDLSAAFDRDPLGAAHWGRNPLRIGPVVAVDWGARAQWVNIGMQGDISACAPGEFTSDRLVDALRSR